MKASSSAKKQQRRKAHQKNRHRRQQTLWNTLQPCLERDQQPLISTNSTPDQPDSLESPCASLVVGDELDSRNKHNTASSINFY